MEIIPLFTVSENWPVITAFTLGLLTAISPCPLATNITAIGFISRDIENRKRVFINGLLYTLGRVIVYTLLGMIIIPVLQEGASMFAIQKGVSQWGELFIGPALIVAGVFMLWGNRLNLPKFGFRGGDTKVKNLKGGIGSLMLGMLFALAFCPTSGVFYFGMLMPMAAISAGGYWLPVSFAIATSLPVICIAWILAYYVRGIGHFYNRMKSFEKWMKRISGILFISVGIYYLMMIFI